MTAPTKQGQNPQPCTYKNFPKVAGRNIHFAKVLFLAAADRPLLAYLGLPAAPTGQVSRTDDADAPDAGCLADPA